MDDSPALWRAFSRPVAAAGGAPMTIAGASGCWVTDDRGRSYLDAVGGLWYCTLGHGRRDMADAIRDQVRQLDHYPAFGEYQNDVALELAEALAARAPGHGAKVLLQSGGSDGIDTAVKLARQYWARVGRPEKTIVVGRDRAYHGVHGLGTALGGISANRSGQSGRASIWR